MIINVFRCRAATCCGRKQPILTFAFVPTPCGRNRPTALLLIPWGCACKSKFLTFRFCRIYFRFRKTRSRKMGKIVLRNVKNRPIFRFLYTWFAKGALLECERNPFGRQKGPFRNPSRALFGGIFGGFSMFFEAFEDSWILYSADIQRFMKMPKIWRISDGQPSR